MTAEEVVAQAIRDRIETEGLARMPAEDVDLDATAECIVDALREGRFCFVGGAHE